MGAMRGAYRVRWGNLRERDHFEPGVVGTIILRRIFREWDGGMDWFDLTQNRDR